MNTLWLDKTPPDFQFKDNEVYHFETKPPQFPHTLYRYPGSFPPEWPRFFIKRYSQPGDWVLDPFSGGGTTAVEAMKLARNIQAVEINPVSQLVTTVKCTRLDTAELGKQVNLMRNAIKEKIASKIVPLSIHLNGDIDRELDWIYESIGRLDTNTKTKNLLKVCYLSVADSAIDSRYTPVDLLTQFLSLVNLQCQHMQNYQFCAESSVFVLPYLWLSRMPLLSDYFQVAIGSPPYLSQDYTKLLRKQLNLLGIEETEIKRISSQQVGQHRVPETGPHIQIDDGKGLPLLDIPEADRFLAEVFEKNPVKAKGVFGYIISLCKNLIEVHQALADGGHYVMINSDNRVLGKHFEVMKYVKILAERIGYESINYFGVGNALNIKSVPKWNRIETERFLIIKKVKSNHAQLRFACPEMDAR